MNQLARRSVVVLIALLAGCNAGSSTVTTTTPTSVTSALRIVHGSPDTGPVDVRLDTTTGTALASGASYGSVSAYTTTITSGAHVIDVVKAGTSTAVFSCMTTPLLAGSSYTLVIAGSAGKGIGTTTGLQCQLFGEPTFSTPSGQFSLNVHHASPAANAAGYTTVSYGTYPNGTAQYSSPLGSASYFGTLLQNLAQSNASVATSSGVTSSPGVGIWFAPQTANAPSTVLTTITPSQAVAGKAGVSGSTDATNILPTGSLVNFSIYLVDGQAGTVVRPIGAFD